MKRILIVLTCMVCLLDASYIYAESVKFEEIVVVATREREDIIRVPANVTVITAEDIEMSGVSQITELLRSEAGLTVTNTAGSSPTGITVEARGFNNGGGNGGRTLVLIDGRKANDADSSIPDWASIPLDNIDRVEIIRGPATAIYGDSAMASVINIITKKGIGKPTAEIRAEVGSWQKFDKKLTLQGSTKEFSYFIFGNHNEEDGFRDRSNFRAQNYTGKFSYLLTPKVELMMKTGVHTDERELPGSLTEDDIVSVGRRGSATASEDDSDKDQFNIDLGISIIPDEYNSLSTLFYFNHDGTGSLSSIPGSGTTSIDDDEKDFSLTQRYTTTHPIMGKENKATIGIDLLQEEVDSDSLSNYPDPLFPYIQEQTTNLKRKSLGLYLHDEYSISKKILLGGGIRFDRVLFDFSNKILDVVTGITSRDKGARDFSMFSPKVYTTVLLNDNISTYLSYAKTFRLPNRDELTGFWGFTPELDPEKGENIEAGIKTFFGTKFRGGVTIYHMKVEDEILLMPPNAGEFAFGQNENFDKIVHRGLELTTETKVFPGISLSGNYALIDTEIEKGPFKGSKLPITPKHSGSIAANIDMGYGFYLWNQARFAGKRYLANDLSNTFDKLPGFGVWDARLSYVRKGRSGSVATFLRIDNVLDKKYEEFGGIGGYPFGSRIGVYPSPDRSFAGGLTYTKEF